MYETHPCFNTPPDDTVAWRYTSLEKFIDLALTSELFLARLDTFPDQREGQVPLSSVAPLFATLPVASVGSVSGIREAIQNSTRKSSFVSCWHNRPHESDALWHRYSSGNTGIAIESTIGDIKQSLASESKTAYIGSVSYIDYEAAPPRWDNMYNCVLAKRREFDSDSEVRIVSSAHLSEGFLPSLRLRVDLTTLIRRVHLSPLSDPWVLDTVRTLCQRLDIKAPVLRSNLYSPSSS